MAPRIVNGTVSLGKGHLEQISNYWQLIWDRKNYPLISSFEKVACILRQMVPILPNFLFKINEKLADI